jgi:hypothetical protein
VFTTIKKGHKIANEIRTKKRSKKRKVVSRMGSSSILIAKAIHHGNQLDLLKFLYEKGSQEGRANAGAQLMKLTENPAPHIASEEENDSDDLSSNDDEPPRHASSTSFFSQSKDNGKRSNNYSDPSHTRKSDSYTSNLRCSQSSSSEHQEPNQSQSSLSNSSNSLVLNRGGQSQFPLSTTSGSSNLYRNDVRERITRAYRKDYTHQLWGNLISSDHQEFLLLAIKLHFLHKNLKLKHPKQSTSQYNYHKQAISKFQRIE